MYLLPRPKKVEERQGAYEIGWNTVITIDGTLSENGCVYAGLVQECIRNRAGIECAVVRGEKREGDL